MKIPGEHQAFEHSPTLEPDDPYWRLIATVEEVVGALNTQRVDYSLAEADEIALALRANNLLDEVIAHGKPLFEAWLEESRRIDPSKNPEEFLEWDGTTEPSDMRHIRIVNSSLEHQRRKLSGSLLGFVLESYVKHHPDGSKADPEKNQAGELVREIYGCRKRGDEFPLEAPYAEIVSRLIDLRFDNSKSGQDLVTLLWENLRDKREKLKPEYKEAQISALNQQAGVIIGKLSNLWGEVLAPPQEDQTLWQKVKDHLTQNYSQEDERRLVVEDAVNFLSYVYRKFGSDWIDWHVSTDWDESPVISLHRLVTSEEYSLHQRDKVLSNSKELGAERAEIATSRTLNPRIRIAVSTLLHNQDKISPAIDATMEKSMRDRNIPVHILRQILEGPPLGEPRRTIVAQA